MQCLIPDPRLGLGLLQGPCSCAGPQMQCGQGKGRASPACWVADAMEEGHRQGSAARDASSLALSLTLLSSITADSEPQPQRPSLDQQVPAACTCVRWRTLMPEPVHGHPCAEPGG